ncbi:MAG: methyl-accepting chemotaxis protein [Nibricoccus sp.]
MEETVSNNPLSDQNALHLDRIARASIQLASLGPQLASLAGELEKKAQEQARRAASAADTMLALTADLQKAVEELKAASTQVGGSLGTVEQIALHTRILSLNASIEAARAGVHGRGFAVVVDEVQKLADRTGKTTKDIEQRVSEMQASIVRVADVTAATKSIPASARTIGAVNGEVQGIASLAAGQLDGARSLHSTSNDINSLAELLLIAVGNFRFQAHHEAEAFVAELLPELLVSDGSREDLETKIAHWLTSNPCFELAYITDGEGRQIVDNLVRTEHQIARDRTARGRNWSDRPWFIEARSCDGIVSTDIYRSTANNSFCFTVSTAVRDIAGEVLYVFGSDVNFQCLVSR